jgi:phage tail tape-measure protein
MTLFKHPWVSKDLGKAAATNTQEEGGQAIARPHTHGGEVGAIAGEVAGAVIGSAAGPAGTVAGMIIGAAAGALAGEAIDEDAQRVSRHESDLDDEIGVTAGNLGRPAPSKPE